jgi:putative PIN family toxin of toxin-antitoxin system
VLSSAAVVVNEPAPSAAPAVVLDTNVVLDWLLFRDPACAGLAVQLQSHQFVWHATAAMREELAQVLPRPQFLRWNPDIEQLLAAFDHHSRRTEAPTDVPAPTALRCRDSDDQKFIDLACALGARWLFSRDRALLDLARAAHARGVEILTPTHWQRRNATIETASTPGGAA